MSRSGYSDDCDGWALIRWRGAVAQAIRGHRGQHFIRDLLAVLDAMPNKRLIAGALEVDGEVCALGSVLRQRGIPMSGLESEDDVLGVAEALDISEALVKELAFENDDGGSERETPEQRWQRIRRWAVNSLAKEPPHADR